MKKLTRQERIGALALAGVAILVSASVFLLRHIRGTAEPMPTVTVIHTSQDKPHGNDTAADGRGHGDRKGHAGDAGRKKKGHKKNSGRDSRKKTAGSSDDARRSSRSPLDEPVPMRTSSTKE